ncbi:hypothetical protein LPJ73_003681, partial [Coemansia sp. RSA 2703]
MSEHYLVSDVFEDCRDVYAKMQGLRVPVEQPIMSPIQSTAGERPQITVGIKRKRYMPAAMGSSPALNAHPDALILPQVSAPSNGSLAIIHESALAAHNKKLRISSTEHSNDKLPYVSLSSSEISSINGATMPNERSSLTVVEVTRKNSGQASGQASDTNAEPRLEVPVPTSDNAAESEKAAAAPVVASDPQPAISVTETSVTAELSDDMTEKTFVSESASVDNGESASTRRLRSHNHTQKETTKIDQVAVESSETSLAGRRRSLDVRKTAPPNKDRRASSHAQTSAPKAASTTKRSAQPLEPVEIIQDSSDSDDSDSDSGSSDNDSGVGIKTKDTSRDMRKEVALPATKKPSETLSAAVSASVTEAENDDDEDDEEEEEDSEEDDSDDDDESDGEHSEANTSNLIDIEASVASGSDDDDDEEEESDDGSEEESNEEEEESEAESTPSARPARSVASRRSIESDSESSSDEESSAQAGDTPTSKPADAALPSNASKAVNGVTKPTTPTIATVAEPASTSEKRISNTEQPTAVGNAEESEAEEDTDSESSVTDSSDPDSSDTESSDDDTNHDENLQNGVDQAKANASASANAKGRGPRFAGAGRNEDSQVKTAPVVVQSPNRKRPSLAALEVNIKTPPKNGGAVANTVGIPDTPNTLRRKRLLRKVVAAESDEDSSDTNDDSDSPPRKLASLPILGTPAPGRKKGIMDLVKDRNTRAGKDGSTIKSISQMASAKPYDSLRKQIIKSAVKQPQETAAGSA